MRVDRGLQERSPIQIVELSPDEWEKLRDIKIRSLDEEPVAFEDPDPAKQKWTSRSEAEWRDILSGKMSHGRPGESINLFARSGQEIVGMVAAIIPEAQGEKTAKVQHMYVTGSFRGQGLGKDLLQNLLTRLKSKGVKKVQLEVVATQAPAIELYKSVGFVPRRQTESGVQRSGKVYEELEMELDLT